jgi:hypothetical protein
MMADWWERLKGAIGVLCGRYAWYDPTPPTDEEIEEFGDDPRQEDWDRAVSDAYDAGRADGAWEHDQAERSWDYY